MKLCKFTVDPNAVYRLQWWLLGCSPWVDAGVGGVVRHVTEGREEYGDALVLVRVEAVGAAVPD